jgi:hypothetical protein
VCWSAIVLLLTEAPGVGTHCCRGVGGSCSGKKNSLEHPLLPQQVSVTSSAEMVELSGSAPILANEVPISGCFHDIC